MSATKRSGTASSTPSSKRTKNGAETKSDEPKRCVLAYSGGLDTSCILLWLIEQGYEVICYCADVGQVHDDLTEVKAKALNCGAKKCYVEDLRHEFVTDYVFPLIRSNAVYESRYLLGTSVARPVIAKRQVEIAQKENCQYVAHGATGKGNDQVRFELSVTALDPSIQTIAPWRNTEFCQRFQGRQDLLQYAASKGVPVDQTPKASYSVDENLLHTSYESGILENPALPPPTDMFKGTKDPITSAADEPENIRIEFKAGDPIKVTNKDNKTVKEDPLELFVYLNELGNKHGVGRIDIVENRFVGIKSRGVYETPGGTILRAAHQDLEGITVDRDVLKLRDRFALEFAKLAYDGFWFAPEMHFVRNALDFSQQLVDGWVDLTLYKGNVIVRGRDSPMSLYSQAIASMDEHGDYNPGDAAGFIKINSMRLRAHHARVLAIKKEDPARLKNEYPNTLYNPK